MAGIFAYIDSDLSKLRQLKAEIENVKKALKSINVKVNIDIAQGLEVKLKSLTGQYDALVKKISEAEGKILASTQRINQAAERIINAQEKLAKATGAQPQSGGVSGTSSSVSHADTASVQAQAKAYDELEREINSVLGTRMANIKRMMEEQNAIRLINEEIKKLEKLQGSTFSPSIQDRLARLNNELMEHKISLSEARQALNNSIKLDNAAATSMDALSQSLGRMRMAYRQLNEEERNSPFGQELLASIQQADAKIKQLDASIGNHQRNVGNYASSWNGLGMSIQQIGRELPSLAMGWNTFFLAISNNLPILADEIKRARVEYDNLKNSGQKAVPVWKQIASSLVSWQTALTVGITLLTLYGGEVVDWVKKLFSANEQVKSAAEIQDEINKKYVEGTKNVGAQISNLKSLQQQWKSLGGDLNKQKDFIEQNNDAFRELGLSVKSISDAENLLVKNTGDFIESLKLRAQAVAANELASEQYAKQLKLEMEAEELGKKAREQRQSRDINAWYGQQSSQVSYNRQGFQERNEEIARGMEKEVRALEDQAKAAREAGDAYYELGLKRENAADTLLSNAGLEQYRAETKTPNKKKRDLFVSVPDEEVSLITPEEIQKNIDLHREMMDKFLADYGTYQQKREAIADMYALKIAQAETEGERLSLQKQSEEALQKLDFETFKDSIDFADIFGNLDEQTTDAVRVLRDKLKVYIDKAASELRPEDLKELQDAFSKLDLEIAERDPWEEMKSALQEYRDALREVNEAKEESISKTESQAKAEGKLQAAEQKRMEALSKLTTATNALGEQGVQVVNMGNQLVDMLSSFGVEVPEAVSGALDGLGQVMNGLANLDFSKPFSIITSAVSVFTGLGKTIGSLFGIGGADYSGYEEMRSQYEALLSVWDDLIAKKKEYINISYGAEAIKAAEEAQQLLDRELQTYRQLADQLLASGAGIGSHSIARRIEKRMTAEDWARVSGLVGTQLSGDAYDLFDLDPSVIGNVLNDEKLLSVLNEVAPKLVEYIQNIASYEEGVNEVTDALNESLTGVSFDEFQNSFVDMLSNLDATNEDFADNLEKYLQNAIFSSLVANQYKSRIQKLYNQWSDYAESDNSLTSDEAGEIRKEYNQIVNDMLADRNQIMETMGWQAESSSQQQQASSGGFQTMSQDSADELNGRFTALQMSGEEIKNQAAVQTVAITQMKGSLDALAASSQKRSDVADEVRSILAQSYLELQEIRENTGAIVAPIRQIQNDIAEVKQNTARI